MRRNYFRVLVIMALLSFISLAFGCKEAYAAGFISDVTFRVKYFPTSDQGNYVVKGNYHGTVTDPLTVTIVVTKCVHAGVHSGFTWTGSTAWFSGWFEVELTGHTYTDYTDDSITITVSDASGTYVLPGSVGGVIIGVDKLSLLAPYIGLTSTILVVTVASAIYIKRIKSREEK